MQKTDDDWKKELGPERFRIARQGGTERAFTGKFYERADDGTYLCVCCNAPLFTSDTKYESGSGWPSFYEPVNKDAIKYVEDHSHGMTRVEVRCGNCDCHLGHVFEDGPKPTGQRYCINSASLAFQDPSGKKEDG